MSPVCLEPFQASYFYYLIVWKWTFKPVGHLMTVTLCILCKSMHTITISMTSIQQRCRLFQKSFKLGVFGVKSWSHSRLQIIQFFEDQSRLCSPLNWEEIKHRDGNNFQYECISTKQEMEGFQRMHLGQPEINFPVF